MFDEAPSFAGVPWDQIIEIEISHGGGRIMGSRIDTGYAHRFTPVIAAVGEAPQTGTPGDLAPRHLTIIGVSAAGEQATAVSRNGRADDSR